MSYDVISAEYVTEYKIRLIFEDGKNGVVDFEKYIKKGGVYKRLDDIEYFKRFQINKELGILTWDNEIDVAPETLYSDATGEPLPQWMFPIEEVKKAV
jgi:hypothetical protein